MHVVNVLIFLVDCSAPSLSWNVEISFSILQVLPFFGCRVSTLGFQQLIHCMRFLNSSYDIGIAPTGLKKTYVAAIIYEAKP